MSTEIRKPSEKLMGWVLHPRLRNLLCLLSIGLVWWLLRDYPWWLWAPACFLAPFVVVFVWLISAYSYQKATYPQRACATKRRRRERAGG